MVFSKVWREPQTLYQNRSQTYFYNKLFCNLLISELLKYFVIRECWTRYLTRLKWFYIFLKASRYQTLTFFIVISINRYHKSCNGVEAFKSLSCYCNCCRKFKYISSFVSYKIFSLFKSIVGEKTWTGKWFPSDPSAKATEAQSVENVTKSSLSNQTAWSGKWWFHWTIIQTHSRKDFILGFHTNQQTQKTINTSNEIE